METQIDFSLGPGPESEPDPSPEVFLPCPRMLLMINQLLIKCTNIGNLFLYRLATITKISNRY